MFTRQALTAPIAVAVLAVAGCSSSPPPEYQPPPGALIAGTAQVTVNGQDAGTTTDVQCDSAGTLMIIETGNPGPDTSGATAMVGSKDELVVRQVGILNLGGFTGSYNSGLGGEATVTMTDRTYDISGTAAGFATDNPSFRTTADFTIKIAC